MRRVCVVITARPSYSRIKTALVALKARPDVELQIICAASAVVTRFGRIVDQVKADGFTVNAEVSSVVEDDTLCNSAVSTGLLLTQLSGAFERLKPDVVVTIADRHETLATAIAASYQHIPLCHIQGGEVTGSIDDKVRNAVSQLADLHLVATEAAAVRVKGMKRGAEVYVTGCPSIDIADQLPTPWRPYTSGVIVLQHPVTTEVDQAGAQMEVTIKAVRSIRGLPYTFFWPGEDAGASAMNKRLRLASIKPVRNKPPMEFLRLLASADCLVGNSSVGIRECSFLGVPVVNIGTRQQGRERAGNVIDVKHDVDDIATAIRYCISNPRPERSTLYGDGHAGERIAGILAGKVMESAA